MYPSLSEDKAACHCHSNQNSVTLSLSRRCPTATEGASSGPLFYFLKNFWICKFQSLHLLLAHLVLLGASLLCNDPCLQNREVRVLKYQTSSFTNIFRADSLRVEIDSLISLRHTAN